jgi:predicted acylesterase/phospholipase RssA
MATAKPSVPQAPLAQADYFTPTLECDVVMKGGITSGVVYPLAVCELAKTYRFRCIGGTSAGAIAAAATAAAEYGRRNGGRDRGDGKDANYGFHELAGLPEWLGRRMEGADRSNLFALFQPQPETDALFDVATATLRGKSVPGRLVQRFPLAAVAGALPGAFMAWAATQARPAWASILAFVFALAIAGVGALAAAGWMLARKARKALPENGFGLCSGNGADVNDPTGQWPALTPWLADLINRLAGKPRTQGPLTFGDLSTSLHTDGKPLVDLQFMTTNLTHGRPYELPTPSRKFYYDPEEFAQLFPEWVMQWLDGKARAIKQAKDAERRQKAQARAEKAQAEAAAGRPPAAAAQIATSKRTANPDLVREANARWQKLLPLPESKDLPVVVCARMSLSFPVLFSAVPLYAVDYSREDRLPEERAPEQCWFSDGGICSNFPVHLFDSPLPMRPTFGLNLRPFPLGQKPNEHDQSQNVWLPEDNGEGIEEWFTRIEERAGWKSLVGFGSLIVNAMQNWVDNTQMVVAGYRDRVAHVLLTDTEGGLNLNMDDTVIRQLGERGLFGAGELARRFDPVNIPADTPLTWDNHRWVRFRSSMQLLDELLRKIGGRYRLPDVSGRSYADLVARTRDTAPRSYSLRSAKRAKLVDQALSDMGKLAFLNLKDPLFEKNAPNPLPELRTRPKL